jgi:prepilin-type N-terminal cleavage/methylation domain-containing protein
MTSSARSPNQRARGSPVWDLVSLPGPLRARRRVSTPRRRRSKPARRDGFTLVELLVAMFIVVVLFLGFGRALAGALQTSRDNRLAQEATGIATQYVELARSLAWVELGLSSIDATAPLVAVSGVDLDGAAVGLEADEPLVYTVDGLVAPRVVEVVDETPFTVWSYVSEYGDLRRVVVEVAWSNDAGARTFRTSTLVSEVTAG